jgi:hypothetical protein
MAKDDYRIGTGERGGVVPLLRGARRGHAGVEGVERYWSALRGDRLVPLRSEIDPRGIEGALDRAFILERIAPGVARFRLAGSQLVELMGAEVRGMPLSILFAPESRKALAEAVEGVFSGPETLRLSLSGERGFGRGPLSAEMVVLPLKSDLGDVSRALGCFGASGALGRAPRRLIVQEMERVDLLAGRSVEPAILSEEVETSAEPAEQRLRPVPGAPHLSVVEPAD